MSKVVRGVFNACGGGIQRGIALHIVRLRLSQNKHFLHLEDELQMGHLILFMVKRMKGVCCR